MFFSRYPSQFREIAIDPQISTADGENSTQRQMKFPKLEQIFPKNLKKNITNESKYLLITGQIFDVMFVGNDKGQVREANHQNYFFCLMYAF